MMSITCQWPGRIALPGAASLEVAYTGMRFELAILVAGRSKQAL